MCTRRRVGIFLVLGGRTAMRGTSSRWPRRQVLAPASMRKLLGSSCQKQVDTSHKASSTRKEYCSCSIRGSARVKQGYERLGQLVHHIIR